MDQVQEHDFLTIKELCATLRISRDTLRRKRIAGKLTGIELVDFFGDGKLRAKRTSVESFIAARTSATNKIYSQSHPNTRA